jgi:hypothetical protein
MINDALLGVSKSYNYAVPCIDHNVDHHITRYYRIRTQHHTDETKKQTVSHSVAADPVVEAPAAASYAAQPAMVDEDSDTDVEELQRALAASFRSS